VRDVNLHLHTARTTLRPLGGADLEAMHAMWTDEHVRKFLWDDVVITKETAAGALAASADDFSQRQFGLWAIDDRTTAELVGFCGLRQSEEGDAELLYGLLPAWCGKGLATEAARAVLKYAFTSLGLGEVVAATDVPNTASVRVMERLGMQFERRGTLNGLDTLFYRVRREEFRRLKVPTIASGLGPG
jgi:[ribosomal protein S5]-alanine N-acetyltransferase